jgi:hypothetical protein
MRLRQLFESKQASVAFCFGRFNPAHQGHAKVWNTVKSAGHQWFVGTNPTTVGPNDPLPFDVKSAWMMAIDPELEGHLLGETSVLTLASKIFEQVGEGATIAYVTDAQDWQWSGKLLNDYNGKQASHGYYNFSKIKHVESPRVMSATELRKAARAGDEQLFYKLAGVDLSFRVNSVNYCDTVVAACGANPEKVKRAKKGKTIAEESNLIKYANRVIREMRAREFLAEISNLPDGERHQNHKDAGQGYILSRDVGGYDRTYHLNRIMMATAMADGKSKKPVDMPDSSFVEKYNVAFPYTDEERLMMFQALATIPSDSGELEKRAKSRESSDTNKTSPVNKPKKNKYGI